MEEFVKWLYATPTSSAIRDVAWVIPTVQSIHILAITVLVGAALVSDLRLAGMIATDETPATVVRRYLPWLWIALVVLLLTGALMSIGEPDRVFTNAIFWIKMAVVLFAFVLTLLFRRPLLNRSVQLEHTTWARLVKPMAWISLAAWVCAIFCGRWIAYSV